MRKEANSIDLESCEVSSKSHTCLLMMVHHFGVASETILIGHTQFAVDHDLTSLALKLHAKPFLAFFYS